MNEQEEKLADAAKRLLDESIADLDGATLSRLARARNRALAGGAVRKTFLRRPLPMFGLAASTLTAVALVLMVLFGPWQRDMQEKDLMADLGILTAEESLEFFEEIEFYQWLATADDDEDELSGLAAPRPVAGHAGAGPCPIPGNRERGAECGNVGVSGII